METAIGLKNNKFRSLIPYNALNKFIKIQNGYPRIQILTVEGNLEALSNISPNHIPTQHTHTHIFIQGLELFIVVSGKPQDRIQISNLSFIPAL